MAGYIYQSFCLFIYQRFGWCTLQSSLRVLVKFRYSKVYKKKDSTQKIETKLSHILTNNKDRLPLMNYRQLTLFCSKLSHMDGLPKIYKDGIPSKPIFGNRLSAYHPLSRFLVDRISSLAFKSMSYMKISTPSQNWSRISPMDPIRE